MDKKARARLLLLEIAAVQEGDYQCNSTGLTNLIAEVFRDAAALAEEVLQESDKAA